MKNSFFNFDVKEFKRTILCTVIFFLVAHGFIIFNASHSHDSLAMLFYSPKYKNNMIAIGRFLRPFYCWFRGEIASPLLAGALYTIFSGSAFFILFDVLEVRNYSFRTLLIGILVCNYTVTALFATYIHDADCYALSFLLAVIGMYININAKGKQKWGGGAIVAYVASLGLYQAYMQVIVFCFLLISLKKVLNHEDFSSTIKKLFVENLLPCAISMGFYFLIHKIILYALHLKEPIGNYNSISSALDFSSVGYKVVHLLWGEIKWLLIPYNYHPIFIALINVIIFVLFFKMMITLSKGKRKIAVLIHMLMIPFGIGAICLISGVVHELTTYSFYFFYFMPVFIYPMYKEKGFDSKGIIKKVLVVLFSIIILDCCIYSNSSHLKKELEGKTTLSVMTRIMERIEQLDGYIPGETPVTFVGFLNGSSIKQNREGFPFTDEGLKNRYSVTFADTYRSYLNEFLGYPIKVAEDTSIIKKFCSEEEIENMPAFPKNGCCKMISPEAGVLFKLSDSKEEDPFSWNNPFIEKLRNKVLSVIEV